MVQRIRILYNYDEQYFLFIKVSMLRQIFICFLLSILPTVAQAEATYHVRLLTHFGKKINDSGLGVGGWLIIPDVTVNPAMPIFLVGPRYQGDGYWVEVMAGPKINKAVLAADPDADPIAWVQSTRFQITPKALKKPINVFGNVQFIDVLNSGNVVPYLFCATGYVLPKKAAVIGLETENYLQIPPGADEQFNDLSLGPHVALPFKGVNIIMSYQFHFHENVEDQVWVRAMYNFPGPLAK